MEGVQPVLLHLLWVLPLVLLIFFIASPRFRGDMAEARVRRILAAGLDRHHYTIINDLVIPFGGGTIHLDHVVVSKFGIFLIESHYARGWVSGSEFQERWKQYHLRRFTRFENPVHQNSLQREALQSLLGVPATKIHPIVVMVGQRGFKTAMPEKVLEPEKLIQYIRKKAHSLLDARQSAKALRLIEEGRFKPDREIAVGKWGLLRFGLLLALVAGGYVAFQDEIAKVKENMVARSERQASPELFRPDGSRKSEQEIWEDSLVCAWSSDTGRCACFEPDGTKASLEASKCRSLANRGSILEK
jgi:hypothetical protein